MAKVCSECGSERVEYAIPAWFDANTDKYVSADEEADTLYTFCHDCDESRSGDWIEDTDNGYS
jgi:hypothetical protein